MLQVEFADVIVLNKVDRVDPSSLPTLRALVQKLNPMARIVTTTYSKVSPQVRLETATGVNRSGGG